ncbi:hypothetical protein [Burkholderia pseudomallei]|uniref:hypothetical protein n=1 Tax=Burkholderia pseudomallei TaxID=28450 RepID=UPI0012F4F52F|nr:hypothetical protein [Burkholderia pseudomallei]
MSSLINLPGVAGGRIDNVPFFHSVSQALHLLSTYRACTSAGDHGAATVYRGDDGRFHCIFHRRCIELDQTIVTTKKDVRRWLVEWYPHTHQASQA